MRVIGDLSVFLEGDSGLHFHNCIQEDADLKHEQNICDRLVVVVVKHLVKIVENNGYQMCRHNVEHV